MVVFKIAGMFLFGVIAMTTSQQCIKRYVGGEWITHGDCGNLPTMSSVLRDIEERAKKEELGEKAEESKEDPKDLENFITEQSTKGNIVTIETTVNEVADAPYSTSRALDPTGEATTHGHLDMVSTTATNPKELENFITEQSSKGNIVSIETTVNEVTDAPDPTSSAPSPTGEATTATTLPPLRCGNEPWKAAKSLNETGGVVDINITVLGMTEVYCDNATDGGGWIVFQRRMDGSENFFRNWTDYEKGFGTRSKEFWLGLKAIHQLSKDGNHELRIDMIEWTGTHYYAKYSSFKVRSASTNYAITASGYSGNSTDSLLQYRKQSQSFTTRDRDNDRRNGNCAELFVGGWWYSDCHLSNLNGLYGKKGSREKRIAMWNSKLNNWMNMKFTEMKLRKKIEN